MALDLTTRKPSAPAAPAQRVGLSTFVRNKLAQTMTGKKLDTFIADVVSLVSNNPAIAQCEQASILSSCLQAQSLGLSLNQGMGQAWIVPYKDKKKGTSEATFLLGYKGYVQLAIRSGQYKKLNVLAIKAGELKRWDPLNEDLEIELIEDEHEREKAPTIGYYAMFEYLNGFKKALYWSKDKMEAHADRYSQAFSIRAYKQLEAGKIAEADRWKYSSPWYKDFDAMAAKTMLRQIISKWGIMSIEMQTAFLADGKTADGEYIDGSILDNEYQQTPSEEKEEKDIVEAEIVDADTGEVKEAKPKAKKEKATVEQPSLADSPKGKGKDYVECPDRDNIIVGAEYCNQKCQKRAGCPAWEE